jgi:hypothetical protein
MKLDKILHHDITEILLKVALNTINQANLDEIQTHSMLIDNRSTQFIGVCVIIFFAF